jgi:hypothetical protein
MNNPSKYVYHSSSGSTPHQYSQISQDQANGNQGYQGYRVTQPYQYNYSYSNIQPHHQTNNYTGIHNGHANHNGGYQFSQYHMNNNYNPHYTHNDEQLLEDLPGD